MDLFLPLYLFISQKPSKSIVTTTASFICLKRGWPSLLARHARSPHDAGEYNEDSAATSDTQEPRHNEAHCVTPCDRVLIYARLKSTKVRSRRDQRTWDESLDHLELGLMSIRADKKRVAAFGGSLRTPSTSVVLLTSLLVRCEI